MNRLKQNSGHVYGVKRLINNNSKSSWERTDDAIGLIANATKDGSAVQNDFNKLAPWNEIISFNIDLTTKRKKAYFGDANFKFDGTNGDVYTKIPDFYYKIWKDDAYEYIQISDSERSGFIKSNSFEVGRYHTGLIDNVLRSYSGITPARYKTLPAFRTLAKSISEKFGILDFMQYDLIKLLYLVEYADYNAQSTLGFGMSSMRVNLEDKALVAENTTNRIIINTSSANNFIVGQIISIGTSSTENFSVASDRKIVSIVDYSEGEITGKAITFDGKAVNIAVNNVIWTSGQLSGGCDTLGMLSGCLSNDGKHAIIYRGLENFFGNVWHFIDGINLKDRKAWICTNPDEYVSDKFEAPYVELEYTNVNTNGYIKALGFDINNPLARFPIETGGGNTTYVSDYYYGESGNVVALVGGRLFGGANCGPWCWYLNFASSFSSWNLGARLSIHQ